MLTAVMFRKSPTVIDLKWSNVTKLHTSYSECSINVAIN